MTATVFVTLPLLFAIFAATLTKRGRSFLNEHIIWLFWATVGAVMALNGYFIFVQYTTWQAGELYRFLLPPHGENYFYFYAFMRFLVGYAVSLSLALFVARLLPRVNQRYEGRFFEPEESYMAAAAIFATGHPGWLFYLVLLIALYLLLHTAYYMLHSGESIRLPLYYMWVPVSIFVILIGEYWLSETALWKLLKI